MVQWLQAPIALSGAGFDFQHAHGSSQLSLTSVLRDPILSSDLCGHQTYSKHLWKQSTHTNNKATVKNIEVKY